MTQENPEVELQENDDQTGVAAGAKEQRIAIALILTVLVGLLAMAAFVSMGASAVGLRMPGWLISIMLPGLCALIIGGIGYFFWKRGLADSAKAVLSEEDIRD